MNTFVANQTQVFLIFILCGALIGLLFDAFRILRKSFKTPDIVTYIEDIVFWILTCFILAYTIFYYNNGEIRAYLFIGLFVGITLYILFISKFIIKVCTKIIKFLKNMVITILSYINYPLKLIFTFFRKIFFKPISFVFINIRKSLTKICKKNTKIFQKKKDLIWFCRIIKYKFKNI